MTRIATIAIVILSLPGFVLVVAGQLWVVSCDWLEEKLRRVRRKSKSWSTTLKTGLRLSSATSVIWSQ